MTGMLSIWLHTAVNPTTIKGIIIRQQFTYEIQTVTNVGDTSVSD